jgi:cell division protein FtsZ
VDKKETNEKIEWILSLTSDPVTEPTALSAHQINSKTDSQNNSPSSAATGGYLAKPSNIYAEPESSGYQQSRPEHAPVKEPILDTNANPIKEEEPSPDMQIVFKDDIPAADVPGAYQAQNVVAGELFAEEPAPQDEAEIQKQRAAERIQKLRNLSFNINAADPNNEFETVPAYIRRNLELYNTISNVEDFYSKYEVKKEDDNSTRISTINTFLDGKKPD